MNETKIRMLETSFRSIIIEHHQMLVIVVIIIVEISPWEARSRFSLLEFLNLDHYLLLSLHHQHLLLSESSDQNQIQHCQHQPANNIMYSDLNHSHNFLMFQLWFTITMEWLYAKETGLVVDTIMAPVSACWLTLLKKLCEVVLSIVSMKSKNHFHVETSSHWLRF